MGLAAPLGLVVRFRNDVRVGRMSSNRQQVDGYLFLCERRYSMSGPLPAFCPQFPEEFLATVQATLRRKAAPQQLVPRCRLVLLLHENPYLGQEEAGRQVGLSGRQVLRWRRRWAAGEFSIDDAPGRGRKAAFSPPGTGRGQGHRL